MPSVPEGPLASRALRRVGASLCGRYRLQALIGLGGMAAVYAAVHRNGHAVAIKILHDRLSADPEIERLFRREALLANKINHPGVVPVIDDDVSEDGCIFLVMPLLEGETLRARSERLGGVLPVPELLVVAHAMLGALGAAHAQKIVHRDIKPENVFLTHEGETRVLDFGIGRFFESADPVSATRSGRAVGTPAFMAPEQALGRVREIDGRTDLWALGATMYTLLSGRLVHEASNGSEILVLAATRPPKSLSDACPEVAPEICEVVDRALSFERDARWPDALAMARALDAAASASFGAPISAIPSPAAPKPERRADLHTQVTRPPRAENQLFRDDSADGSANRSGRGSTQALRLAVTRTLRLDTVRPKTRVLLVAATALATVMGGVAIARKNFLAPTSPVIPSKTPVVASAGVGYYEAGLQAMTGASTDVARSLFAKATEADPSLAAAHLRYAMLMSYVEDSARAHFSAAERFRAALDDEEQHLLDALEPLMRAAPDPHASTERLRAAIDQFPKSRILRLALSRRYLALGDGEHGLEVANDLIATDGTLAAARQLQGAAFSYGADSHSNEAKDAYRTCLRLSPRATSCLRDIVDLDLNEGDCADAELHSRALIAGDPDNSGWYLRLAEATFGQRGNIAEATSTLQLFWSATSPTGRKRERLSSESLLAILQGHFDEAGHKLLEWREEIAGDPDETQHERVNRVLLGTMLELGDAAGVRSTANAYLEQSRAWTPSNVFPDSRVEAMSALYAIGDITRDQFARYRDEWAESMMRQNRSTPADRWIMGWAAPAKDERDGLDALAALPRAHPFEDLLSRNAISEDAAGGAFLLAHRLDDAIGHLSRGSRSCTALRQPVQNTHAYLKLGSAYEAAGAVGDACTAYAVVLQRWGQDPRSTSAERARHFSSAHCAGARK